MAEDARLERNVFESPKEQAPTPPPDGEGPHPVSKLLDARFGLIVPTERVFLFGVLAFLGKRFVRAVEIGTWRGTTMHVLRRACDELYCVDPKPQWIWDPAIHTRAGKSVQLIAGYSPACLCRVPMPLTFVFVDGDHSRDGVYRDAKALESLMEPGGVICFHDANHPPVKEGLFQAEKEWTRPHRFNHLACDTISRTPEGIYGGLSVIIVEPDAVSAPGIPWAAAPTADKGLLTPFSFKRVA